MKTPIACFLVALSFLATPAVAQRAPLDPGLERLNITVEGVARDGLVYAPPTAKTTETPVVFVWHGHGGTAQNAARSFGLHRVWPEAISVYLQGLNTPGRLTDPEGKKPGWQHSIGAQGDRDLKLFDAVLAKLKEDYKVDARRIYSTGHSNGGGFTYLLWAARGEVLAAVAPSAAASPRAAAAAGLLKPKPAMHLAGEKDPLVKYEWQQAAMAAVRKLNGCEPEGKPWAERCTLYESEGGTPFVAFIHPGGHEFHRDAPPLIAKFFQQHSGK